jgi:hypothetical protein
LQARTLLFRALQLLGQCCLVHCHQHQLLLQLCQLLQGRRRPLLLLLWDVSRGGSMVTRPCCRHTAKGNR